MSLANANIPYSSRYQAFAEKDLHTSSAGAALSWQGHAEDAGSTEANGILHYHAWAAAPVEPISHDIPTEVDFSNDGDINLVGALNTLQSQLAPIPATKGCRDPRPPYAFRHLPGFNGQTNTSTLLDCFDGCYMRRWGAKGLKRRGNLLRHLRSCHGQDISNQEACWPTNGDYS